ncbi:MAG: type II secretion system minor pseudopilin GspI [Vibrionaceae bacterium]
MKQRGFTLIEIMIALAIFSVSAMAVLNSTGQNINSLAALEKKTFAAMVADNQLALLLLSGAPDSERSGTANLADQEWHWTIKPVPTASGMLRAVDVIVWESSKKSSELASVRTYVSTKK